MSVLLYIQDNNVTLGEINIENRQKDHHYLTNIRWSLDISSNINIFTYSTILMEYRSSEKKANFIKLFDTISNIRGLLWEGNTFIKDNPKVLSWFDKHDKDYQKTEHKLENQIREYFSEDFEKFGLKFVRD